MAIVVLAKVDNSFKLLFVQATAVLSRASQDTNAGNRRHFGPSIFLDVNILRSIEASISMYSTNNSSSRELVSGGPRSDTGLETVETTLH